MSGFALFAGRDCVGVVIKGQRGKKAMITFKANIKGLPIATSSTASICAKPGINNPAAHLCGREPVDTHKAVLDSC